MSAFGAIFSLEWSRFEWFHASARRWTLKIQRKLLQMIPNSHLHAQALCINEWKSFKQFMFMSFMEQQWMKQMRFCCRPSLQLSLESITSSPRKGPRLYLNRHWQASTYKNKETNLNCSPCLLSSTTLSVILREVCWRGRHHDVVAGCVLTTTAADGKTLNKFYNEHCLRDGTFPCFTC